MKLICILLKFSSDSSSWNLDKRFFGGRNIDRDNVLNSQCMVIIKCRMSFSQFIHIFVFSTDITSPYFLYLEQSTSHCLVLEILLVSLKLSLFWFSTYSNLHSTHALYLLPRWSLNSVLDSIVYHCFPFQPSNLPTFIPHPQQHQQFHQTLTVRERGRRSLLFIIF